MLYSFNKFAHEERLPAAGSSLISTSQRIRYESKAEDGFQRYITQIGKR